VVRIQILDAYAPVHILSSQTTNEFSVWFAAFPKLERKLPLAARSAPLSRAHAATRRRHPPPRAMASQDVEEAVKRINSHKGVIGMLIVNNDGVPIKVSAERPSTPCGPMPGPSRSCACNAAHLPSVSARSARVHHVRSVTASPCSPRVARTCSASPEGEWSIRAPFSVPSCRAPCREPPKGVVGGQMPVSNVGGFRRSLGKLRESYQLLAGPGVFSHARGRGWDPLEGSRGHGGVRRGVRPATF
jgi:hypothetical protein